MNRYVIGWWHVASACLSTWERSLRQQRLAFVPNAACKSCLRRSPRRIVVPFSIAEPTKASWYLSVTADAHCLCTVTAILPPSPPQTCHWIRCGEDSCHGGPWPSGFTYRPKTRPTSYPMRESTSRFLSRRGGLDIAGFTHHGRSREPHSPAQNAMCKRWDTLKCTD